MRALPPCLVAAAIAALAVAPLARAESLYVIEQLVVGVSSTPEAGGERIATVKSGDEVEVIEREGDSVHVRLASGRDGWIRSGYLSATEPLRVQLTARAAEVARLTAEVTRLQGELASSRTPAKLPPARAAPAPTGTPAGAADESNGPRPLFTSGAEDVPRRIWPWALSAAAVSLAVGFGLGALVLDRHIRRKYGGLRIY